MQLDTPTYNRAAMTLHWLIAALIMLMFFFGLYAHEQVEALREGNAELQTVVALFNWHKTLGLLTLVLAITRLGLRLAYKAPPMSEKISGLERFLAGATHILFYFLIIGIPLSGWLVISTSENPSYFFNNTGLPIPEIWGNDSGFHEILEEVHEYAAFTIMGLLVLHVAAALKHHFIDGADTLARMIPGLRPKGRSKS